MKRYKIILAAALMIGIVGCANDGESASEKDERLRTLLLSENELVAMVSDSTYKLYDKESDQVSYNETKTLYMVSNYDYSTQYTLSINGELLLNNKISVDYKANNVAGLEDGTTTMEIIKIDTSDLRYWLWSSDLDIGFVVDFDM